MRFRTAILTIVTTIVILPTASARAGDDDAVLPFLDDSSFLVVRVDDSALDIKASLKWLISTMESAKLDSHELDWIKAEMAKPVGDADEWVTKFRAAGGKRIYLVMGLSDFPDPGPFVVVPVEARADGKALSALFPASGSAGPEQIGAAVVFGDKKTRERLKQAAPPKPRPDLDAAMAAVASAPARAVLIPSAGVRQMLEIVSPKLPKELGGGPIAVVSQGVRWAAVGVHPPAEPSVTFIVEARDADAATELMKLAGTAMKWALLNGKHATFDFKSVLNFVMPKVEGNRITIALNSDQIHNMVVDVVAPALGRIRNSTAASHSLNCLRQLAFSCEFYATRHQDKWPNSLDDAVEEAGGKEALQRLRTAHPRDGLTPHYTYRKPANPGKKREQTILIYESFDNGKTPQTVGVIYLDGHAEMIDAGELTKRLNPGE